MDEFFPNKQVIKPKNYWNYETCKEESLKYKTRFEFQKNKSRAYNISWKNKWLDEFFPIKKKNMKSIEEITKQIKEKKHSKSIEEITQQIIEKEKKHSKSIENLYRMLANKI